ncbi:hypothetical protein Tco_0908516 [Tanacetum coccineum]|uniref:Uncharacterized protein n=1 Tax=Tanacetum coccineum TaxID=301880 RepID=A0ABQ5CME9_9ASTR
METNMDEGQKMQQRWRLTVGASVGKRAKNAAKMATNSGCKRWQKLMVAGRGHANLLCIVPILSDVPEGTRASAPCPLYKASKRFHSGLCGINALAIFWLDSAVFFPNDNKLTISFVNQLRIYERHEDEQNFIVRYTSIDMG